MIDRSSQPWVSLPKDVTVDEMMLRLWITVTNRCSCGGKPYDDDSACVSCQIWHETMGRYLPTHVVSVHVIEPAAEKDGE